MTENKDKSIVELAIEETAKQRGQSVKKTIQDALKDTDKLRESGEKVANLIADEAAQQITDAARKLKKRRK